MTDLWVFDYVGGALVQQLHQSSGDDGWGVPQMSLAYGSHHVYFVASRGQSPVVSTDGHTITWNIPSDTFWQDYEVDVVSTSNGNRAVTLDRVVTRLSLTIADELPVGMATLSVVPGKWFYGLDYMSGGAVGEQAGKVRMVSVPASYIGTAGKLTASFFGFSGAEEWITGFTVSASDGDGLVIGSSSVKDAPFKRNRSTDYSGPMFKAGGSVTVSVNDGWSSPYTGEW